MIKNVLYRCWHWPARFTISRRFQTKSVIITGILTLIILCWCVMDVMYNPAETATYFLWILLKWMILLPLPVCLWFWFVNAAKPGIGWIYIPHTRDYWDDDYAYHYYRRLGERLERQHNEAKQIIQSYESSRALYAHLDTQIKAIYRAQKNGEPYTQLNEHIDLPKGLV